jgi:phosphoribosylformylglycinamidine cyclo-ligase
VLELISKGGIKGIAHITGGGFTDNIPRVFPKGLGAVIHWNSWGIPTLFKWIQEVKKTAFLFIIIICHYGNVETKTK